MFLSTDRRYLPHSTLRDGGEERVCTYKDVHAGIMCNLERACVHACVCNICIRQHHQLHPSLHTTVVQRLSTLGSALQQRRRVKAHMTTAAFNPPRRFSAGAANKWRSVLAISRQK